LRDDEGDVKKSVDAYLASIAAVPDFSPPYRAMGIHYMKHNEPDKAISYFTKYLELSPHASDIGYIKNYISKSQSMRGK
jgi:tetratricopeptide (TPR) repeat protein